MPLAGLHRVCPEHLAEQADGGDDDKKYHGEENFRDNTAELVGKPSQTTAAGRKKTGQVMVITRAIIAARV